jgi:hypothetical protein
VHALKIFLPEYSNSLHRGKLKLILSLTPESGAIKVKPHAFLTFVPDGGEGSCLCFSHVSSSDYNELNFKLNSILTCISNWFKKIS